LTSELNPEPRSVRNTVRQKDGSAQQAAEKRAEATSEAQEDVLPESEHPKE
jgi:hypothetical protein